MAEKLDKKAAIKTAGKLDNKSVNKNSGKSDNKGSNNKITKGVITTDKLDKAEIKRVIIY